jgi:acyl-coenzyme A synthetase/AMP-(fatty) acid ligase
MPRPDIEQLVQRYNVHVMHGVPTLHYKKPRAVEFRDELPKSAVGKILKRELKAEELKKIQASAAKA